ncbi:permease [Syntrophotalea acetylenivorans]|uniref:Permease n=1 Tax=Syntrophotalea acetylenivorans TaxID=1842532 RepID=A0A1L3GMI0_9BACT|nr:SO_0444 family Cu/Zn efflux transporter [Syntrophotalea acetylenivorans]APG27134.1 permease [Syntrophotalea acetylenivorans]
MLETILGILAECWDILVESAPYVLFGFFAAGLLKALVPEEVVARHLGKNSTGSVLKASLFGVPLPLCSCGVIPAAIGLRKQGASKGASASFLVSVPETGVDSIAITWALLDPIMTLVRPVSAFLTATVTGLLINLLPEEGVKSAAIKGSDCGCSSSCSGDKSKQPAKPPLLQRVRAGLAYAFGDLLGDIGKWLLIGIAVAGVISYLVPNDFFIRYLSSEFTSLLIMLVIGIPLYICASASTPIAAALVLKGLSPGAALVFLLAGPATNAATLTVVGRYFGRASTAIYLASIAICSLLLGYLVNRIYAFTGTDITRWIQQTDTATSSFLALASAVVLLALIIRNILPKSKKSSNTCGCGESCSA